MQKSVKFALLASALAGMALLDASAGIARQRWHDDHFGSIATSPATGGYCDMAGCPDHFWRYPIHYGPVFFHGRWYRGPVYFRGDRWGREFWVRGGWHRDEWRGPRPYWARDSHDGPPLAFEYYRDHGFDLGDHWRREHDAENGGRDWNTDAHDRGDDWHHDRGPGWQSGDNNGDRGPDDWHGGADRGDQGPPGADNRWHAGNGEHGWQGAPGQDHGGQRPGDNVIHVTAATYGATCHQPTGNVTKFVSDACDGKSTCDYVVRYQTIGDPAPGCGKDFSVQWTCSAGPGGTAAAPAEAGFGSKVSLQCGAARP